MKRYTKNPRIITEKSFHALSDSLDDLGDLSGVVHDLNSDQVIGGNQRSRVFDINKCQITIAERYDPPDRQGTVAHGFVIWKGAKYAYRQVRWTAEQCEEANIKANKLGGEWDFDTLANEFEIDDLLDWGFDEDELVGVDFTHEELRETQMKLGLRSWVRFLISAPLERAGEVREVIETLQKLDDEIEIDYGSNERPV